MLWEQRLLPAAISPSSAGRSVWAARKPSVATSWTMLIMHERACALLDIAFALSPSLSLLLFACFQIILVLFSLSSFSRITKALPSIFLHLPFSG